MKNKKAIGANRSLAEDLTCLTESINKTLEAQIISLKAQLEEKDKEIKLLKELADKLF